MFVSEVDRHTVYGLDFEIEGEGYTVDLFFDYYNKRLKVQNYEAEDYGVPAYDVAYCDVDETAAVVIEECPEDYDPATRFSQDGVCGFPDFNLLIGCYGSPTGGDPTCEAADMNGDGFVDFPDFNDFIGLYNGAPGPRGL